MLFGCAKSFPLTAKSPMESILLERSASADVANVGASKASGTTARTPTSTPAPAAAPTTAPARAKVLIVFLPGGWEVPKDIVREGFVNEVRKRNIDADVQVVDSHIGYFIRRTFPVRLREDIVLPAKARGYEQIWFAGISLGGFGSLLYSYLHPGDVDGVIAIAPHIAARSKWRDVIEAGGLAKWQPKEPLDANDYERGLLTWLKAYGAAGESEKKKRPVLFIGYGTEDGMPQFDQLNAGTVPESQLLRAPGKHDWPPWKQMWADVLDRAPLPRVVAR
jgi:pimeloyl-ACP methyl ester carboxylesterase